MKLYFYFLKNKDIEIEECEVIERKKTYKPINNFPQGWIRSTLKKDEIGKISGYTYYNKVIILTEPDIKRVCDLFTLMLEDKRHKKEEEVQDAINDLGQIDKQLKMIEKWRKSYE